MRECHVSTIVFIPRGAGFGGGGGMGAEICAGEADVCSLYRDHV